MISRRWGRGKAEFVLLVLNGIRCQSPIVDRRGVVISTRRGEADRCCHLRESGRASTREQQPNLRSLTTNAGGGIWACIADHHREQWRTTMGRTPRDGTSCLTVESEHDAMTSQAHRLGRDDESVREELAACSLGEMRARLAWARIFWPASGMPSCMVSMSASGLSGSTCGRLASQHRDPHRVITDRRSATRDGRKGRVESC